MRRRRRRRSVGRIAGLLAPPGGVADGAVDTHAREADRHLRQADRHLVAVLAEHAERRVPPGRGRYSGKTRGSTSQIQYGTPCSASVPVDPKRKCSSSDAKYGAGSSRKNFTYVTPPRIGPTTTTASRSGCSEAGRRLKTTRQRRGPTTTLPQLTHRGCGEMPAVHREQAARGQEHLVEPPTRSVYVAVIVPLRTFSGARPSPPCPRRRASCRRRAHCCCSRH